MYITRIIMRILVSYQSIGFSGQLETLNCLFRQEFILGSKLHKNRGQFLRRRLPKWP